MQNDQAGTMNVHSEIRFLASDPGPSLLISSAVQLSELFCKDKRTTSKDGCED
jgi:hypothetical protein